MKRSGFIGFLAVAFLVSSLVPAFAQAKLPVIDAAMMPQHSTWPAYMAMKNGWDKEAGFQTNLKFFDSGMGMMEALPARQWGVASCGTVAALVGALRYGIYLVAISNDDSALNAVLVRPDSPMLKVKGANPKFPEVFGNAESVKGKTFLVTTVSSAHYALSTWLERLGLKDSDIVIKNMEQAQALTAFQSGVGDAVVLWAPFMFTAMEKGAKIVNKGAQKGAAMADVVVVGKEYADKNPEMVAKFLKAYFRSLDAMKQGGVKLAPDFKAFMKDWGGADMSLEHCALDIENHPVFDLKEQIALFDSSKGPSEVEQWVKGLADFFVAQKRFKQEEMDKALGTRFVTDKFLKMVK